MLLHPPQQQQQQILLRRSVPGSARLSPSTSFRLGQGAFSSASKARFPSIFEDVSRNSGGVGSDGPVLARVSTLQSAYDPFLTEGPSCVFVGPVETADKDRLEALYQQVFLMEFPSKSQSLNLLHSFCRKNTSF